MVLKRIGVLSVGRMFGGIYAAGGLLVGAVFALVSVLGATFQGNGNMLPGAGLGVAAVILSPLIYGAIGFIGGAIMAALYNLFAGLFGGIELEIS